MVEIMRSKMYYGRARVMSVLPVFLPMKLQSLPLVVNSIFKRITDILRTRSDKGSNAAKLAGCAFGTIVKEEVLCDASYFSRVWTLAERMVGLVTPPLFVFIQLPT